MAVRIIEDLHQMSILLMLLCSFCFYRYLKNIKRERKLTAFEFTMYIITPFATFIWGVTSIIKFLSES